MFEKLFGKKSAHEKTDIERRFNLIGRVGQGSMSRVWKATDLKTGNKVAVKVLDKEKTARFESRFKGLSKPSEGEIAVSLKHPCITVTNEFGWTTEDEMFLVMEFVEGVSLSLLVDLQNDEMKRFRLRYMIQIGEALNYLHQQNWIHRDICPRNVMISDEKKCQVDRLRTGGSQSARIPPSRKSHRNSVLYGPGIDQATNDRSAAGHFFLRCDLL